jgi:hypothetical protein
MMCVRSVWRSIKALHNLGSGMTWSIDAGEARRSNGEASQRHGKEQTFSTGESGSNANSRAQEEKGKKRWQPLLARRSHVGEVG